MNAEDRAKRLAAAVRRAEFQLTQQGVDGPGDGTMVFYARTLRKIRDELRAALAEVEAMP